MFRGLICCVACMNGTELGKCSHSLGRVTTAHMTASAGKMPMIASANAVLSSP